jgi:anthranilate phosphoribosyltransferase
MTTAPPDPKLWPDVLGRLVAREDLPAELAEQAMETILGGGASDAQVAGFAIALRAKGETVTELAALVRTMLRHAERVVLPEAGAPVVDTCGTGGDGSHTVNVSTMAGIVVAGAGLRVAKHGNRAMSSACGSADVLEALGVEIDLGPEGVAECIAAAGIGFCLAPRYHPAMRFAGPARRDLGVRTTFNFLGPLANPAGAPRRVVGVSDRTMAHSMIGALAELGCERAMVFCGDDGLDELTTTSSSTVWELEAGEVREYTVEPRALGLPVVDLDVLVGGDARCNADIARRVLEGDAGPVRDIVALNAAAALVVTDVADHFADGVERAMETIDSGRAAATLDAFVAASRAAKQHDGTAG